MKIKKLENKKILESIYKWKSNQMLDPFCEALTWVCISSSFSD